MRALLLLGVVLAVPVWAQNRGVPQDGFPNWAERTVHMRVNRSRADPTADPKACASNTVRAPMMWHSTLGRSTRFHSTNMQKSGQFMHNSPCVIVSNISSLFLPNTTCDGSVACACTTGAITCTKAVNDSSGCSAGTFSTMTDRMNFFGAPSANAWAENIAAGYTSPTAVHTGWMNSSGHCTNILGDYTWFGVGYLATGNYWTENFRRSSTAITGTLIAGSHEPQLSGANVAFRVNYYNTTGGPQQARLNVDGVCTAMTLERGTQTNGTWLSSQMLSGTTCRRYVFTFTDPSGNVVTLPETGSYGVGGSVATCADWTATAPTACPSGGNQPPTIMTAARATPNPVTATTTAVSVLGADDAGEAALTYTWSATGPASVAFSPNSSNAAKASTATFTRAGSYVLTVTVTDAGGATVTSTVNVTVNATPTSATVAPTTASVAAMAMQTFTAAVRDQFNQSIAAPTVSWTVSGGGTISASGVFTAGSTGGGPFTVTATSGSANGTAQVTVVANAAPTIATAAAANPSPVTGSTTALSVLGADDAGEAALLYAWSATGPATVTFSPNGTNAAKASTATFTRAGTYSVTVTVRDVPGLTVTSTVSVTVNQTPTTLSVAPSAATLAPSGAQTFTASVVDQFAQPITATPTWTVSGGGTISTGGLFTAGTTPGGPFTVTAAVGSLMGTAAVSVSAGTAPTVGTAAAASPSTVAGTSTGLSVLGADDGGEASLTYTWAASGPAAVTYSANSSNGAKSTTATFTRAGTYVFTVTIRDAQGLTVTSTVTVTVAATPTTVSVSPSSATVIPAGSQTFTALVADQFAQPLAAQPTITWTVSAGGSIASSGVFTAGTTAGGPHTVTATAGTLTGTASLSVSAGVAPTLATVASATPNPVVAMSTQLAVLGADDQGESALVYSWDVTGPTTVALSPNDSNAAKASTASFTRAGSYSFTAMVRDVGGLTATSQVTVVVNATLTAFSVAPASVTLMPGQMATFMTTATDQFGDDVTPAITWSASGGGAISNGVFTAGSTAGGPFTITATAGARSATAQVIISATPPPALTVQLTQPTSGAQVSDVVSLGATTSDDTRVASVAFVIDGVELSSDTTAPWSATWDSALVPVGQHLVKAVLTDGVGDTVESAEVPVEVVRAVVLDTTAPVVTIGAPVGDVRGAVTIEATATDDVGVREVRFLMDGAEVAVLTTPPWTHQAGVVPAGAHTIRVTARDAAGNLGAADGTFTVIGGPAPDEPVVGGCGCSSFESLAFALGLLLLRARRSRQASERGDVSGGRGAHRPG